MNWEMKAIPLHRANVRGRGAVEFLEDESGLLDIARLIHEQGSFFRKSWMEKVTGECSCVAKRPCCVGVWH